MHANIKHSPKRLTRHCERHQIYDKTQIWIKYHRCSYYIKKVQNILWIKTSELYSRRLSHRFGDIAQTIICAVHRWMWPLLSHLLMVEADSLMWNNWSQWSRKCMSREGSTEFKLSRCICSCWRQCNKLLLSWFQLCWFWNLSVRTS